MVEVLVVGAGPVGLTMAGELARHGVRCRIVDRLAVPSPYCRAIGVTPRTLEVWDDIGIARDMIDAGIWLTGMRSIVAGRPPKDELVDLPDLPYGILGLPQYATERVLARYLSGYGIVVERAVTLSALTQSDDAVSVCLDHGDGEPEHAAFRYVVGCDGAHSAVRHALGIGFVGEAFPMTFMLGDVRIDWDLPSGMALRALRLRENDAPDMFIAIPLPEPGRYRVSMLAPADAVQPAETRADDTDHGIQSEAHGPELDAIRRVADDLVPGAPRLADLRWSSLFRISMRLADRYRRGRGFIAGDAAHIHPPTGGQGMNTGIQDAYNLAWKLALVVKGAAGERLLDSYEAERRPVGAEVVARTRAASESYGREPRQPSDRLADTQINLSYRSSGWVADDGIGFDPVLPAAGDRAPDAGGLRRRNVGFPYRCFDILRGIEHVLLAYLPEGPAADGASGIAGLGRLAGLQNGGLLRIAVVMAAEAGGGAGIAVPTGIAVYYDAEHRFAAAYGSRPAVFLIRPDGHIGWRGRSCAEPGLTSYLRQVFVLAAIGALPPI